MNLAEHGRDREGNHLMAPGQTPIDAEEPLDALRARLLREAQEREQMREG